MDATELMKMYRLFYVAFMEHTSPTFMCITLFVVLVLDIVAIAVVVVDDVMA